MPQTDTGRGILLMLLAIATFTSMDALAKTLIASYPPLQVVWARYTGQTVIVALVFLPRLGRLLRTRYPGLQALRSLLQFGATAFFFFSLGHIGLAEATAITDLNPVLITLGAALFLGEKLGPRRLIGVFVALTGALIIIRPGAGVFQPAALLPLCCALCYAGFALATRHVGRDESPSTSLIYSALFGTLVTSALLPFVWVPIARADLWAFLLIGVQGSVAQFFLIRAFTIAEASAIAPFGYVGIVFATGWGILLFDEWPDLWTVVGALVIAGAGIYVWHREARIARAT
ncbi:EamA-like transporter family protein [Gemmobacter aquatilis]|uniref:EamA-like transporter family protein n=1 Tax=Gemmobacter aquatilis TaxID=933059 RepID=A0A1H8BYJ6_9RHOB|nr:DMT family transporter [Gemmobacter aquatilis]SEM87955.1 EamA-like transporter family protein [Gemmobacter aquatilis]